MIIVANKMDNRFISAPDLTLKDLKLTNQENIWVCLVDSCDYLIIFSTDRPNKSV
jgi:hypothetical protein